MQLKSAQCWSAVASRHGSGATFELSTGGHHMVCIAFACLLACEIGHFVCLIFKLLFLSNLFVVMSSSRQTNNSRSVALFRDPSLFPVSAGAEASSSSTVVSLAAPTSSLTAPSLPAAEFAWPSLPCRCC